MTDAEQRDWFGTALIYFSQRGCWPQLVQQGDEPSRWQVTRTLPGEGRLETIAVGCSLADAIDRAGLELVDRPQSWHEEAIAVAQLMNVGMVVEEADDARQADALTEWAKVAAAEGDHAAAASLSSRAVAVEAADGAGECVLRRRGDGLHFEETPCSPEDLFDHPAVHAAARLCMQRGYKVIKLVDA